MASDGKRVLTFSPGSGECAVCDKVGSLKCSRCKVDFYCGKEHQAQHWPRHRKSCGSIELCTSPEVGRCVVAVKNIPAGTILMREVPLVATPNLTEDEVLCVGCFMRPRGVRPCARCGWPVCGDACSRKKAHQPECAAFQRAKYRLPKSKLSAWDSAMWNVLAALRTALAAEDAAAGDLIRNLQYAHPPLKTRLDLINKMTPAARMRLMMTNASFESSCKSAADWVRDEGRLSWLDPEAVRRAAGACLINSTGCGSSSGRNVTALFAGISMVQHSCRPNVELVVWQRVGDPHPMEGVATSMEYVLVASRDIARGDHLGLAYQANFLLGTSKRRSALLGSVCNFLCNCELCSDPSERGLFLDGWCCVGCSDKKGEAFPVLVHDSDNRWSCGGCGRSGALTATGEDGRRQIMGNLLGSFLESVQTRSLAPVMDGMSSLPASERADGARTQVRSLEARLKRLLESRSQVPLKEWERFIADALWPCGPLHPTHSLVLQAKQAIIELDDPQSLASWLSPAEARRVAGYCRDLRAVCDVVCPGASSFRKGVVMALSALVGARVHSRLNQGPMSRSERQETLTLLDEWEETTVDLQRSAICPQYELTSKKNLEYIAQARVIAMMMD